MEITTPSFRWRYPGGSSGTCLAFKNCGFVYESCVNVDIVLFKLSESSFVAMVLARVLPSLRHEFNFSRRVLCLDLPVWCLGKDSVLFSKISYLLAFRDEDLTRCNGVRRESRDPYLLNFLIELTGGEGSLLIVNRPSCLVCSLLRRCRRSSSQLSIDSTSSLKS